MIVLFPTGVDLAYPGFTLEETLAFKGAVLLRFPSPMIKRLCLPGLSTMVE